MKPSHRGVTSAGYGSRHAAMWFGIAERVSAWGNESGRDPMMTWWCAAGQARCAVPWSVDTTAWAQAVRTLGWASFISPAHDELSVLIRRESLRPALLDAGVGFSTRDPIG